MNENSEIAETTNPGERGYRGQALRENDICGFKLDRDVGVSSRDSRENIGFQSARFLLRRFNAEGDFAKRFFDQLTPYFLRIINIHMIDYEADDWDLIVGLVRAYRAGASPRIILDVIAEISRIRDFPSICLPHVDFESWEPQYYDKFITAYMGDQMARDVLSSTRH